MAQNVVFATRQTGPSPRRPGLGYITFFTSTCTLQWLIYHILDLYLTLQWLIYHSLDLYLTLQWLIYHSLDLYLYTAAADISQS